MRFFAADEIFIGRLTNNFKILMVVLRQHSCRETIANNFPFMSGSFPIKAVCNRHQTLRLITLKINTTVFIFALSSSVHDD